MKTFTKMKIFYLVLLIHKKFTVPITILSYRKLPDQSRNVLFELPMESLLEKYHED